MNTNSSAIQTDWVYSYQEAFIHRQVLRAQAILLGHSLRPEFDWIYLGLELAAGRWTGYLDTETTLLLLERISAIAGIKKVKAPQTTCLFTYQPCHSRSTIRLSPPPFSPDSIMDFTLQGDTLVLTTNTERFEVPLSHQVLRGLQGGKKPSELYHLDKDTYDKIQALFYTPATGSLSVQPILFEIGTMVRPVLNGSVLTHDDRITQIILRRGATVLYIGANQPFPFTDNEQSASVSYVLEILREGKPSLTYGATITAVYPIYVGASQDIPTPTQVRMLDKILQPKGNLDIRLTAQEQRLAIAYPASYGSLGSIVDTNGFQVLPSFSQDGSPRTIYLPVTGIGQVPYLLYTGQFAVTVSQYRLQLYF